MFEYECGHMYMQYGRALTQLYYVHAAALLSQENRKKRSAAVTAGLLSQDSARAALLLARSLAAELATESGEITAYTQLCILLFIHLRSLEPLTFVPRS